MTIFATDLEAAIWLAVIGVIFYTVNKSVSQLFQKSTRLTTNQRNKITFSIRLALLLLFIYLFIEGFPSFKRIDPTYTVIHTGAISTALAFAFSETFANFMAGVLLFIVDPFDIGDVVKIKGEKGIVRALSFTKVVLETFDNVFIEFSNSEIISSVIQNYTIKLKSLNDFSLFRKAVESPQDVSDACLDVDVVNNKSEYEEELKELLGTLKKKHQLFLHSYTCKINFPYEQFRIKIDKANEVCMKFKDVFGVSPRFHIEQLIYEIIIKFRITTSNVQLLIAHQPAFAKEIYRIVMSKDVNQA